MHPLARSSEVTVRYGSHAVTLRASLRAAMTIERLHDGWAGLVSRLAQFSLDDVQALIRASAVSGHYAEALLTSFENRPIAEIKAAVAAPLAELVAMLLAPISTEAEDTAPTEKTSPALAKPKPWSDGYAELFRIGTGWLGWTPAETWAATPTEIAQAFEGHLSKLKAIHGAADEPTTGPNEAQRAANVAAGRDPDFDRAGLQALKRKM